MSIKKTNHYLTLRFSHIGDIILLSGVFNYYYEKYGHTFTLLTQKNMAELFINNPAVYEVIELEKSELRGQKLFSTAHKLAKTIDLPLYDAHKTLRSKIFKLFWKIEGKKSFTYEKDAFARRLFLFSKGKIRSQRLDLHVVERYAQLFEKSNTHPQKCEIKPKVFLSEEERSFAKDFYAQRNTENKKIVILHPFATHEGKMWKEENWQKLYQLLLMDYFPLVIGKGEAYSWLQEEHNALNHYSLRESAALISEAECIITGDSAPLHLATSVNTRVISLFGATVKEWGFYPLGENDVLLQAKTGCMPCSLHGRKEHCPKDYACINSISPKEVFSLI